MECCRACDGPVQVETITAVIKEEVKEPAPAPEPGPGATPAPSVKFSFELPDKTTVELDFKEKPLGIDFQKQLPMKVRACKPDTPAAEMKVRTDWQLTHIDGEIIPDEFDKIMQIIKSKVGVLRNFNSANIKLYDACKEGDLELMKKCIADGADVNWHNPADYEDVSLHMALLVGSAMSTKLLLDAGAEVDAVNVANYHALHWGVYSGAVNASKLLIAADIDLSIRLNKTAGLVDKIGKTALEVAVWYDRCPAMIELLQKAATAEGLALIKKEAEELKAHLPPETLKVNQKLYKACQDGDVDLMKKCVADGADVNFQYPSLKELAEWMRTPLICATLNGHVMGIAYLLSAGANVRGKDDEGWTALMHAASGGQSDAVKVLVAAGSDLGSKALTGEKSGRAALDIAKEQGHTGVVDILERAATAEGLEAIKAEAELKS